MNEDLTKRLEGEQPGEKLNQVLAIVQSVDTRMQRLDAGVENIDTHVGSIEARLERLEQKVEHRLYDTRPIWEKVQTDVAQLQTDFIGFKEGQELLHGEVRDIKTAIRDFNRKFRIFNDTLTTMQADYRDIYDRVRGIERQHT
jgi:archaellum component FlaC